MKVVQCNRLIYVFEISIKIGKSVVWGKWQLTRPHRHKERHFITIKWNKIKAKMNFMSCTRKVRWEREWSLKMAKWNPSSSSNGIKWWLEKCFQHNAYSLFIISFSRIISFPFYFPSRLLLLVRFLRGFRALNPMWVRKMPFTCIVNEAYDLNHHLSKWFCFSEHAWLGWIQDSSMIKANQIEVNSFVKRLVKRTIA